MSVDLITEIQASPREFARRYESLQAQHMADTFAASEKINKLFADLYGTQMDLAQAQKELSGLRLTIQRDILRTICENTDAMRRNRQRAAAARKVAQWAREHVAFEFYSKVVSDMNAAYAERDAARAEVARLLKELGK